MFFRFNSERPANFNEHLFGPYWTESFGNLLKCTEAAFAFNGYSYRPSRPTASQVPAAAATAAAGECASVKRTSHTISENFEIYCTTGLLGSSSSVKNNGNAFFKVVESCIEVELLTLVVLQLMLNRITQR